MTGPPTWDVDADGNAVLPDLPEAEEPFSYGRRRSRGHAARLL